MHRNLDPNVGADCSIDTTTQALIAGAVPERQRAVWQLGQIQVFDGGPDGDAETEAGNTLFQTQGVFLP